MDPKVRAPAFTSMSPHRAGVEWMGVFPQRVKGFWGRVFLNLCCKATLEDNMKIAKLEPMFFKWEFVSKPFDIETWVRQKRWIYDADNCGDEKTFWVVMDEGEATYYKCNHNWWWSNYGEEDSFLENEFEFFKITKDELNENAKKALRFVV